MSTGLPLCMFGLIADFDYVFLHIAYCLTLRFCFSYCTFVVRQIAFSCVDVCRFALGMFSHAAVLIMFIYTLHAVSHIVFASHIACFIVRQIAFSFHADLSFQCLHTFYTFWSVGFSFQRLHTYYTYWSVGHTFHLSDICSFCS